MGRFWCHEWRWCDYWTWWSCMDRSMVGRNHIMLRFCFYYVNPLLWISKIYPWYCEGSVLHPKISQQNSFPNTQKVKAEKQDESIDVVEDVENLTFWSSSKILLKNKGKFLIESAKCIMFISANSRLHCHLRIIFESFLIFIIGNGYGCIYQSWIDEFWTKNYRSQISNWCCNSCCQGTSFNCSIDYSNIQKD